jgi:hypothetical protein
METTDPRWTDESRTPGSGNVFVDLGFPPAEAEVMRLRAEVMICTAALAAAPEHVAYDPENPPMAPGEFDDAIVSHSYAELKEKLAQRRRAQAGLFRSTSDHPSKRPTL